MICSGTVSRKLYARFKPLGNNPVTGGLAHKHIFQPQNHHPNVFNSIQDRYTLCMTSGIFWEHLRTVGGIC